MRCRSMSAHALVALAMMLAVVHRESDMKVVHIHTYLLFLFGLVAGHLCVLALCILHARLEILLFGFGDGFGLHDGVRDRVISRTPTLTFILTTSEPPWLSILPWMDSKARSRRSTAAYCHAMVSMSS